MPIPDFFSHSAEDNMDIPREEYAFREQVFKHFAALEDLVLDYYGADDAAYEFRIDGITFRVLEDPNDGYRSCLGVIEYGSESNSIFFQKPVARVKIETYEGRNSEYSSHDVGYQLVDIDDGHVWLEFGTDNTDDYYPYFVFRHTPKMVEAAKVNLYM